MQLQQSGIEPGQHLYSRKLGQGLVYSVTQRISIRNRRSIVKNRQGRLVFFICEPVPQMSLFFIVRVVHVVKKKRNKKRSSMVRILPEVHIFFINIRGVSYHLLPHSDRNSPLDNSHLQSTTASRGVRRVRPR